MNLNVTPEEAQLILNAIHALDPGAGMNPLWNLKHKLEDQTGLDYENQGALDLIKAAELTNL